MWSDNESDVDLLGFSHLEAAILSIIRAKTLLPATVGVFGDWGSGKSSLIGMVRATLEKEEGVVVLPFNGWIFEDYEGAKTALMASVLEQLMEHKTFVSKAKDETVKLGKKLLRRVNWFKAAGGLGKLGAAVFLGPHPVSLGLGVSGGADLAAVGTELLDKAKELKTEDLKEYLKDEVKEVEEHEARRSIREFRKDFEKLLKDSDIETLVIVIDDLDRCSPETIIPTLEAIKLFLFVKRTAFIIGADEELIKYAVRRRFPELPGDRREVGRDYLEKLIQFPIRIPSLGPAEVETYISLLFACLSPGLEGEDLKRACSMVAADASALTESSFNLDIALKAFPEMSEALKERLAMAQRVAPLLGTIMKGNPRQCKRFLNTLLLRMKMAESRKVDLKQRVLAKLMLLEYFRTEFFKQLAEAQALQNGKPFQLAKLEELASGEKASEAPAEGTTDSRSGGEQPKLVPPVSASAPLSTHFLMWVSDEWTHDWLRLEPSLLNEDLRPYFFFSRDRLGILSVDTQRMSLPARQVLNRLLHDSEAERLNGLTEGEKLSGADAIAVFEALATRCRQEEDLGSTSSAFARIVDWSQKRPELLSQFVLFVQSLPEANLPVWAASKLRVLTRGTEVERAAEEVLRKWSKSAVNPSLAKASAPRALKIQN
jgi:hypothetical protein